jgi:hypothetical protein
MEIIIIKLDNGLSESPTVMVGETKKQTKKIKNGRK